MAQGGAHSEGGDQQAKYLADAIRKVKEHGFYCKRAMDSNDLKSALNHASDLLRELRTSLLTPKNYYDLYMKALDEVHHLEDFLSQLILENKTTASALYEEVQACGDVLPRLYLLITVGSCYIASRQAPAKDILTDLVEMAKGVQHPMRGLFLRNYLAQCTKDKLPDTGSKYEGEGGDVMNAVDFILRNFAETNRLWVRMQNQGPTREKKRREKERRDLRLLVGTNLVRLSQLEGVDVQRYVDAVLPKVLEQVVSCKDAIAQPYLLDCVIQVFPDEFHLATLDPFLECCTQLKDKVNVRVILEAMMKRLAAGARDAAAEDGGTVGARGGGDPSSSEDGAQPQSRTPPHAFQAFNACANKLLEEKASSVDLSELLRLEAALLEFALECYPGRLDYVNHCFATCAAVLHANDERKQTGSATTTAKNGEGDSDASSAPPPPKARLEDAEAEQLERVLSLPLAPNNGLRGVLELSLFADLVDYLPWRRRRDVSVAAVKAVLGANEPLDAVDKVERLFAMIAPLVKDPPRGRDGAGTAGGPDADGSSDASGGQSGGGSGKEAASSSGDGAGQGSSHEEDQLLVSKLSHLFQHDDTDALFRVLGAARRHFGQGGLSRIRYTLVPLVFRALALARRVKAREDAVARGDANDTAPPPPNNTEGDDDADKTPPQAPQQQTPPAYSSRKVFQFVHEIVTAMAGSFPSVSLNLFLQCASEADRCGYKAIAYEFVSQAFIIYEDELPDSRAQLRALYLMVGCLLLSRGFDESDYDALVTKTTQYAAKLLKKPDQCRMVAVCSHLFWSATDAESENPGEDDDKSKPQSGFKDARRVLECLQRSLKIADACMNNSTAPIHLFVEILDHYVAHFEKKNPVITPKYISGLVALINEHVDNADAGPAADALQAHYRNTLARIKSKNIIPLD